uniref:Uncharacterized protein n=1 Tax=Ditylenchus dipsaci TaxID=166011 RepID=A0A915D4I0_9BILA
MYIHTRSSRSSTSSSRPGEGGIDTHTDQGSHQPATHSASTHSIICPKISKKKRGQRVTRQPANSPWIRGILVVNILIYSMDGGGDFAAAAGLQQCSQVWGARSLQFPERNTTTTRIDTYWKCRKNTVCCRL